MGINRTASSFLSYQATNYLQNNQSILAKIQERLSSGKNITRPSDNPLGATVLIDLTNALAVDERYLQNVQSALSEVNITDSVLGNVTDLIQRAQELATQGATFSNNADGRAAIAKEVDNLVSQLMQLGNTNMAGKYLFGGMKTDAAPFARTGNDVTYSGSPPSESYERTVEVSPNVQVALNLNGETLLGSVTTDAGPPETVDSGSGILRTLMTLKLNLEQDDPTEIRNRLDEIKTDLNGVLALQAQIGATVNRLELTQSRLEERQATLAQQYSDLQNIDTAKVISDLNYQENVFQTSLGAAARVLQTNLLDFLR